MRGKKVSYWKKNDREKKHRQESIEMPEHRMILTTKEQMLNWNTYQKLIRKYVYHLDENNTYYYFMKA
jgi:hypothetical protein